MSSDGGSRNMTTRIARVLRRAATTRLMRLSACVLFLAAVTLVKPASGESPYHRDRSRDDRLAAASAVAAAGAVLVSQSTDPLTMREIGELSRDMVNRFDRSATYNYSESISRAGDILLSAAAAAPLALLLDDAARGDVGTLTLMYAETMALALILPAYVKGTVNRIRPFVYDPAVPMDKKTTRDARKSFFSRHTSVAFASAMFLSTVYDDYHPDSTARRYVWAASLLMATAVGFTRYQSGEHFPTDIIVGAVTGSAAGLVIPRLHRPPRARLTFMPAVIDSQIGLGLQLRL